MKILFTRDKPNSLSGPAVTTTKKTKNEKDETVIILVIPHHLSGIDNDAFVFASAQCIALILSLRI